MFLSSSIIVFEILTLHEKQFTNEINL